MFIEFPGIYRTLKLFNLFNFDSVTPLLAVEIGEEFFFVESRLIFEHFPEDQGTIFDYRAYCTRTNNLFHRTAGIDDHFPNLFISEYRFSKFVLLRAE